MSDIHVEVDGALCGGHGECVVAAPDVFDFVGDDDVVSVLEPTRRWSTGRAPWTPRPVPERRDPGEQGLAQPARGGPAVVEDEPDRADGDPVAGAAPVTDR